MKTRSRYTKLFALFFASFFALAFTVLPHHHHHDGHFCLGIIPSEEVEPPFSKEDDSCEEECVIRISDAVYQHGAKQFCYYAIPVELFVEKLFSLQFVVPELLIFDVETIYREHKHAVYLSSEVALRGPPAIVA